MVDSLILFFVTIVCSMIVLLFILSPTLSTPKVLSATIIVAINLM